MAEDSADFFAADVRIKATGSVGVKSREVTREFRYHVERTLREKSWRTVVTLDPETFGPTNAAHGPGDVGRIEIEEETQATRVYRRDGTVLPMPRRDVLLAKMQGKGYGSLEPPVSATPPGGTGGESRGRGRGRSDDPRAWMEGLLVPGGDEQRGRRVGQLRRHFGPSRGKAHGADRYVREDGTRTLEVLVDPEQGFVTEVNVADSGRLVQHTKYAYRQLPGREQWLREVARIEIAPRAGADRPTVIEHTIANVRFERRGGNR